MVAGQEGRAIAIHNPANGERSAMCRPSAQQKPRAPSPPPKALPAWRALTAKERAGKLRRLFELMMENQEDLARIMTAEQGKPLAESRGEIAYAASFIEWFAEEGKRVYGDTIPQPRRAAASSCRKSRSACSPPSPRGIFRRR